MRARTWSIALIAATLGAALGASAAWYALKGGDAVTTVAASPADPTLRMAVVAPVAGATAQADEAGLSSHGPPTLESRPDGPSLPPTPAPAPADPALRIAALQRADAVLDSALARHEWTDADGAALRAAFEDLDADTRNALLGRFAVAINRGELVPRTERIPF